MGIVSASRVGRTAIPLPRDGSLDDAVGAAGSKGEAHRTTLAQPANLGQALERPLIDDEVVLSEVVAGHAGGACPAEVLLARVHGVAKLAQLAGEHRVRRRLHSSDRDVGLALREIRLAWIGDQLHVGLGMFPAKRGREASDVAHESVAHGDAYRAGELLARRARVARGDGEIGLDPLGKLHEGRRPGLHDRARRRASNEAGPEVSLQSRDPSGDGGGRQAERSPCSEKARPPAHRQEHPQVVPRDVLVLH